MEVGGWIGAVVAAIGGPPMIVKSFQWWSERADRRRESRAAGNREWEAKLKAREDALDEKIASSLAKCERDCAAMRTTMAKMQLALVLITPEVERYAPQSPLLRHAKLLLAELRSVLPLPIDLPPDMQAQLDELDGETAGSPA